MIKTDHYGHKWFIDEYDKDAEPCDLTELFGKGKEPSDTEVKMLIREKQKWFQ